MTFDTLRKLRKLYAALVAAVVIGMLVVGAFVVHTLQQSRERYEQNAAATSKNLAISLEHFLHSHFQEVDLAMRRAGAEFRTRHAEHRFDDAGFSAYLRTLRERIPHAVSVRGSNSGGDVIYGEDIDPAKIQNLAIREFFARAKDEPKLVFGMPVKSRISGQWVLPLVYGLRLPDGSFGGTAYVNINISRIDELFASLDVGLHGVITLIDSRKQILHRYPAAKEVQAGTATKVSPLTAAVLDAGTERATYRATSGVDGQERVYSIEKVGDYPIHVLVGLGSEDFLLPWHKEVGNARLFLGALALLSLAMLVGARLALNRLFQALEQTMKKDAALNQSLAALTQSESRWRSLTEGLPQMVWTVTPALRFDFLSHHWEDYTGLPLARLLDSADMDAIIHPDERALVRAEWERALAGQRQFRCVCRLRRHDGAWQVFDHHALPQFDAQGAIVCWVGSSTDITEQRAAHDALVAAREEALQAGRAKSDFVANMSHEIRSPMNAVLGMLQLLQQTRLDGRQQDYSAKAEAAARALLGLLNDILDFSKVEAGKLALDPHPFSIDKLLRELAVILSANVGGKDIEVLFQIDPALPQWVVGDALRLQQILLNLAGNAIKFTGRGEVVLDVRLVAQSAKGLSIAFAIRDTGIGISAEQREHIFEGFSQAEASTARRYGGTGLGLAISQRLVRLMGGTLAVDSDIGQGSTFHFIIAFQPAPQRPALEALAPQRLANLSCLVVDDNAAARQVLGEMAQSLGWQADVAASGAEALAAVSRRGSARPYDVVFIDWRMPALDGWETSAQIRQLLPAGQTPLIVMVTAHDRELLAQRQAQLASVLDGVLVKPVTAAMLRESVADARQGRQQWPASVPQPAQRRLEGLHLLLVEDNPTNQQVAFELLSMDGARVELAGCGQAAIDMLQRALPLPDLILMDIQMPDMDGYSATRAILQRLGAAAPPIVAMTANAMQADRDAALDAGMVDHVGKPFELAQLITVILRHARAGVAAGAAPAGAAQAPLPPLQAAGTALAQDLAQATALSSAAALARLGGHAPIYLVALRSFVDEAEVHAQALRAARDGRQFPAGAALMHTLKGLAGTVGADHLAQLANGAEMALKSASGWAELDAVLDAIPAAVAAVSAHAATLES
ncbi:response regulator [Oxalobacteraceae bacterium]|nr:response regulator [Oxalobacteraceae bacterium]